MYIQNLTQTNIIIQVQPLKQTQGKKLKYKKC
jgi:hypothetical protein